ncbi:hypothetical protein [Actinoplanes xinjiangensis]|uniref:hypothetical protein n=1 Tax=Actinoplanes xinjiangensis TaxID=512350 RepID=UPI003440F99E
MNSTDRSEIPFRNLLHTGYSPSRFFLVGLYLIPDVEVADAWERLVGETAHTIDLATETVILFTLGHRPTPGHGVTIDRVFVEDGQLVVEATEERSAGGLDTAVSPAHMIAVQGKWSPNSDIRLRLQVTFAPRDGRT